MAAKLVAEDGILKGLVLSLEEGDHWVVGRDPDACQLLVEDPSASRKHLLCRKTAEGIVVENLSETNPIQINEEEIQDARLLQNGDTVKIGSGVFRFYVDEKAKVINGTPERKEDDLTSGHSRESEERRGEDHPEEARETKEAKEPPEEEKNLENEREEEEAGEEPVNPLEGAPSPTQEQEEHKPQRGKEPPDSPMEKLPETEASASFLPSKQTKMLAIESEEEDSAVSIFDDNAPEKPELAEINFGLLETGRWLLKVISGPNNGAEFSMQTGNSYVLGTDPNACDIVFHDTSVSRQHARITVSQDDQLSIEDLKSRNGTLVDGQMLKVKHSLGSNVVVVLGTTSFLIFDREGEMQTIISPLMPSIVKVLKEEEQKKSNEQTAAKEDPMKMPQPVEKQEEGTPHATIGAFILIGILTGLFVIVGIGTTTLFRSEPVKITQTVDSAHELQRALAPFPSVKYAFNPNTGQLLLVGHVLSISDKNQLMYSLQGMPFIKSLDDSGVVIDEYVWKELNQVLEKNPDWKGITIMSTTPGHFVVSGYLKTRDQADRLNDYLNNNFPYPDLLEKKIVVDQDILTSINTLLNTNNLQNVKTKLDGGEVILSGGVPAGHEEGFTQAIADIKEIPGVRVVRNQTKSLAPEQSIVNISDRYDVTGLSNQGGRLSVIINGRILMKGDSLDGMAVTGITPSAVSLEKDGTRYRIDINR